ncbi:MAG: hypothetical protein ACJAT2_000689 [Bacteriovoracaceae bacterium]|jgi:hypothetical protein
MKSLVLTLILFISTGAKAKFAAYTFKIPCETIELKIISCEESAFSNKSKLREKQLENEDIIFERKGVLVKAFPLKREATKCSVDQNMDIKRYKQDDLKESFFISGTTCKSFDKKLSVFRPNFYCDTPGTPTIFGCFINKLELQNKYEYTEFRSNR